MREWAHWQEQDWQGAAAEFEEAVRLGGGNPKYAVYYSNTLAQWGEHELARTVLGSLGRDRWPLLNSRQAWILGDTFFQMGEHDQVLQSWICWPNGNRKMRGSISCGARSSSARETTSRPACPRKGASEGSPTTIWPIRCWERPVTCWVTCPGAKEAFLTAVEQAPDNPNHLRKLGALYLELGETEPAIRTLERIPPASAESPSIQRLLERAYRTRATGSR